MILCAILVIASVLSAGTVIHNRSEQLKSQHHLLPCVHYPLNVTVSDTQVVLSGKVVSLSRKLGGDVSQVRVIHVYRGLSRVRGQQVKVTGLKRLRVCGGRLPRGAVRIFLLDGTELWDTFELSSVPLRLNKAHLDRLRAAFKGEAFRNFKLLER